MSILQAHEAAFVVDSLFIVITSTVLTVRFNKAGLVMLANFLLLYILIYFFLIQLSFWQIFYTEYHLYLALYGLALLRMLCYVSTGHKLLKFFVSLEVGLHLIMIICGAMYSKGTLSEDVFDVIYDSYADARILIASFQIIGLVTNVDKYDRRGRDLRSNWRTVVADIPYRAPWRFACLLRVKRP